MCLHSRARYGLLECPVAWPALLRSFWRLVGGSFEQNFHPPIDLDFANMLVCLRANKYSEPIVAVVHRGTTCPDQSAGSRLDHIAFAVCEPTQWPSRAW